MRLARAAATAAATVAAVAATISPAAAFPPGTVFRLVSAAYGTCVEAVPQAGGAPRLQLADCTTSRAQLLHYDNNTLRVAAYPGQCVTRVPAGHNRATLALQRCHDGDAAQQWTSEGLRPTDTTDHIRPDALPGQSLQANAPHGPVTLAPTRHTHAQEWRYQPTT